MAECSKVEDDHGAISVPDLSHHPPISWNSGANPCLNTSFTHTPFYCEENVYLLCKELCVLGLADPTAHDLFVVFISNDDKKVPLWHQKASSSSDGFVIWDYHVICVQKKTEDGSAYHLIWDLDSSLPFPLHLGQYISEAFRPDLPLKSIYRRLLRVIHAPIFLGHFASTRAHMRDALGNWISSPPNYEPIVAQDGSVNNLDEYVRMRGADATNDIKTLIDNLYTNKLGVLIKEAMLEAFFSHIR